MNISNFGGAVAFSVLAGAFFATAVTLSRTEEDSLDRTKTEPIGSASDPLQTELARCKALNLEAVNDADCHAAWAKSLERFFQLRRVPADRPIDLLPVAPGTRGAP